MRKSIVCLVLLAFCLMSGSLSASGKPKVVAIAPFCDFSRCIPVESVALRDRVIANLVQNYDVIVLSRSNGKALARENQLESVNLLKREPNNTPHLLSADYSLAGYFEIARRVSGTARSVKLGCTMLIADLDHRGDDYEKVEFISADEKLYSQDATQKIVECLELKPRTQKRAKRTGKLDETWAVLPVKRLENWKQLKGPPDDGLAMVMELSLQESGKLKEIVDHSDIDNILQELQIASLSSATENLAGTIANLVGADKVVMGSVSKADAINGALRLDLLLVDGNTAVILDSATAICGENEVAENASSLVLDFLKHKQVAPRLESASRAALEKESKIYMDLLCSVVRTKDMKDPVGVALDIAKTIYFLSPDDQHLLYDMTEELRDLLPDDDISMKDKRRLGGFILEMFDETDVYRQKEKLSLARANTLRHLPARLDEAIMLANRQLIEHPDVHPRWAYYVLADCFFKKHRYEKALRYAERARGLSGADKIAIICYRELDDPANDRKELTLLKDIDVENDLHGPYLVRKIELTREIEGPEAALKYAERISNWASTRPEVQFEIAKAHIGANNKQRAANLLADLDSERSIYQSGYDDRSKKQELVEEIRKARNELDVKAQKFRKLSEFHKIPEKYKMYVIPIGNPDMNLIRNAIPLSEEFLGCRIEVLPKLPIPEDPLCYRKERAQYYTIGIMSRVKRNIKMPDDAIALMCVTDKDLFQGRLRFVYSALYKGMKVTSYARWHGRNDVIENMLAKEIATTYLFPADLHGCILNTCISSSNGTSSGPRGKKFALCPDCQKKISEYSAEDIYKNFRGEYDRPYDFGGHDKQKWQDEYDAAVVRILEQSKGDAEK